MSISPVRMSEKTPRETPRSLDSGFRKTLSVLDIENAEAMWARKPTATMVQPKKYSTHGLLAPWVENRTFRLYQGSRETTRR